MDSKRKKRKVSKELFLFLLKILEKGDIAYACEDCGEWMEVDTALTCRQFAECIEQAKCEAERLSNGCPDIPVVSYRTALHTEKLNAILKQFNTSCFFILSGDERKWQQVTKC